jgi:arginine utilization protein RocB
LNAAGLAPGRAPFDSGLRSGSVRLVGRAPLRYGFPAMPAADPSGLRSLAERLVAIASVSPDPVGEARVADALRAAMPAAVEHGAWATPDGRPIAWARVRGRSRRTVVLLGHTDTVGASEFSTLGDGRGAGIAFDPPALRAHFLAPEFARAAPAALLPDLQEERIAPGTWMFGRGVLDMKAGLAAAVGALASLGSGAPLAGDALFVACPDEERESQGMLAVLDELNTLRAREGSAYVGVLNLDYAEEASGYSGVSGKALLGVYVIGAPGHAAAPFAGADATQIAASLVSRLTTSEALVDAGGDRHGVPPVALRLRDLKEGYNLQTAVEAAAELNLVTLARPLDETLSRVQAECEAGLADVLAAMRSLARRTGRDPAVPAPERGAVTTYAELVDRAGGAAVEALGTPVVATDARVVALERVRRLSRAAALRGPAVVLYLVPPFYPASAPGAGPVARAAARVLQSSGVPLRGYYPFVSDAAYVAWRSDAARTLAAQVPVWDREYRLPVAAMRALDLDVVNLGPWGRDAHGLFERVHAPWTFGTLPELIAQVAREALAEG